MKSPRGEITACVDVLGRRSGFAIPMANRIDVNELKDREVALATISG